MSGEPRRKAERKKESERKGRERRVRMGDRDRLQHLTGCPGELLKVIEREKDTYGGRGRQDREKETCIVARG